MASANSSETSPKFDQLCVLCSTFFDDMKDWGRGSITPHRDIYSLSKAAEQSCHTCSLMLAAIPPEVTVHLKRDLDRSLVDPFKQIAIKHNESRLEIHARSSSDPPIHFFYRDKNGWFQIGDLRIQHVEDDYTQQNRSPSRSNYSTSTIVQITQWLDKCIRTHSECFAMQTVGATRVILPTRLLDLKDVAQDHQLRLVTTKDLPHDTIYTTLSHCWGGQCGLRLTIGSLPTLEAGFAKSCLPKTFRDAVSVTVDLGIRYLWVDALCIIQDSVDDQDWSREASIMGDVYANSYITLAATTSPNSAGGLLHRRNPLAVWPCRLKADFVIGSDQWVYDRYQKPLIDRAWAFQEWLLSRRLIHFSDDQVRWECYCLAASEVYPEGLHEDDLKYQGKPTKSIISCLRNEPECRHALWERIKADYSEKALTKPSDRLTAFSGIARMVHKVLGSSPQDYLAGLWKQELLQELLWTRYEEEDQPRITNQYIAPTWSWASLNGPFWRKVSRSNSSFYHAMIEDAEVVPVGDFFGSLKSAKLIMQCSLFSVTLSADPNSSPCWRSDRNWTITLIRGISTAVRCCLDVDYGPIVTHSYPPLLSFCYAPVISNLDRHRQLSEVTGLLLQKCSGSEDRYIRVGVLEILLDDTNRDEVLTILNLQYELETRASTEGILDGLRVIEII